MDEGRVGFFFLLLVAFSQGLELQELLSIFEFREPRVLVRTMSVGEVEMPLCDMEVVHAWIEQDANFVLCCESFVHSRASCSLRCCGEAAADLADCCGL